MLCSRVKNVMVSSGVIHGLQAVPGDTLVLFVLPRCQVQRNS